MHKQMLEADVYFAYYFGMVERNTNANSVAIDKPALMIRAEQNAVKTGILDAKERDHVVVNMSVEQVAALLEAPQSATNTPSDKS